MVSVCTEALYLSRRKEYPRFYGIRHLDIVKFWGLVKIGGKDECWPFLGSCAGRGYGHLRFNGKTSKGHVIAYEWAYGPIPEGLEHCHTCNNRWCCNPNHIYAGTHQQNIDDREERYRRGEILRRSRPKHAPKEAVVAF
jgi:hypothetical protein